MTIRATIEAMPDATVAARISPPKKWITTQEAEELTGFSARHLGRLVKAGVVNRRKLDKVWEYNRHDLEHVDDRTPPDAGSDLLDVTRSLLVTMGEPMRLYVEHLERELARMTASQERLLTLQVDLVRAREESLSEAHEREARTVELEAAESRKTLAMAQGMKLIESITSEAKASKLVGSLTAQQIEMLLTLGGSVLTQEQLDGLRALQLHKTTTQATEAANADDEPNS